MCVKLTHLCLSPWVPTHPFPSRGPLLPSALWPSRGEGGPPSSCSGLGRVSRSRRSAESLQGGRPSFEPHF